MSESQERLLVQIASYNTNLQGVLGLPQDLVDWLAPTLQVSSFLSRNRKAPDIVAVGFQELLPLHLALSGWSKAVLNNRNDLILSQIEQHAPNKERYALVAKVVNGGVALLVYARDDTVARNVCDVHTQWTGSGPGYMANKGAVGLRFRVSGPNDSVGESFTFVCAHLTAHQPKLKQRIADWNHILGSLLFPPLTPESKTPSSIYDTSHLFFLGDLNFRLDIPKSHRLAPSIHEPAFADSLSNEDVREELKEYDQLLIEKRKGSIFVGFHEGKFWGFKCSYKYQVGEVDRYSPSRTPSWTDRILYATHADSPDEATASSIENLLYTSIPSYTTSDHKPVVTLLLLPASSRAQPAEKQPPMIKLPPTFRPTPDPKATLKRYTGRILDRIIGTAWWLLTLLGAGSVVIGIFNCIVGVSAWGWWRSGALANNNV